MTPSGPPTAAFRERWLRSQDGLRLYFRDYGDPLAEHTAVLCLAGLARNCKDFDALASRLCGQRRVLCPDYRGRGGSDYDPDWRHYQPRTYADDVRHLLAATNVHRVAVVGTSLGGVVAMVMGVAFPTTLAGVVLNDIGPEIGRAGLAPIVDYLRMLRAPASFAEAADLLRRTFPDLPARRDQDWLTIAEHTFRETGQGLAPDWDRAIVRPLIGRAPAVPDLWPLFRALRRVPVLAIRGAKSRILAAETLARMADEMPRLRRVVIGDCGHAPALDEPEAEEAIDELLRTADGA